MKINIIGGSGFIGTRLVDRICKNPTYSELKIIDKKSSTTFPDLTLIADVREIEALRNTLSPESCIIHLAAEHRDDVQPVSLYDEVNIQGAKNVCNVASEKNITTIIFTSTVAVYGFAPVGTDENGKIAPFNDYGRTKYTAENIFKEWQMQQPLNRTLVIIRPTVVFGEENRGNVYNLIKQIATKRFIMIGTGENRKSIAYVENVVAFIEHTLSHTSGVYTYNYVDKPDLTMNDLVSIINKNLKIKNKTTFKIPFFLGILIGLVFDMIANFSKRKFSISSIRIRKFCADSVYNSSIDKKTKFIPPVSLEDALQNTIKHDFILKDPSSSN